MKYSLLSQIRLKYIFKVAMWREMENVKQSYAEIQNRQNITQKLNGDPATGICAGPTSITLFNDSV
jgi:hypothetical protein